MADKTKADLEQELAALVAENENLRGQLAASGARRPGAPVQHEFVLSEGQRLELETTGVTTYLGRTITRDQARAKLAGSTRQQGVEIADLEGVREPTLLRTTPTLGVPHVDYVYPSVAPGVIDQAVAGTPGVNGPAASPEQLEQADELAEHALGAE